MSEHLLALCRNTNPFASRDFKPELTFTHDKRKGNRSSQNTVDGRFYSTGQALESDLAAGGGSMDREDLFDDMGSHDWY